MIALMIFLLVVASAREVVGSDSMRLTGSGKMDGKLRRETESKIDNSISELIRVQATKKSIQRPRRSLEEATTLRTSHSTEADTKEDYERAVNETISEYHKQRKAVMDRYYARQREIAEKFAKISSTLHKGLTSAKNGSEKRRNASEEATTTPVPTEASDRIAIDTPKNDSSPTWIYRSSNWNPTILDNDAKEDLNVETSNTLERSADDEVAKPGYYKLGEFRRSKNEKVVYQHNLGLGVKGPSQLDATFQAVIEGPYEITVVEAYPYANSRANFTWLGGGPGEDFVKLKLRGYENEGFSYSVKIWGVPKSGSN